MTWKNHNQLPNKGRNRTQKIGEEASGGGGDRNSSIDDFSFKWPLFVCSRGKLSTLSLPLSWSFPIYFEFFQ